MNLGKTLKKFFNEFSYQTGIFWKYLPEDRYRNKNSRYLQRENCSPNNLLYQNPDLVDDVFRRFNSKDN